MNYFVCATKNEGNSCVLGRIQMVSNDWDLKKGISMADNFPGDAFFAMDPRYPKDVRLCDSLINLSDHLVVSRRVVEFLKNRELQNTEYLRTKIINHKGRVASDEYYVVNLTKLQDCLDKERSGCKWSEIIPSDIVEVDELVLDESKIDTDVQLFRLKDFDDPILIREDLADEITKAGFTGFFWGKLQDFGR